MCVSKSLLIQNGTVYDGNGSPAVQADIRIRDGAISEIGPHLPLRDEKVFDAQGMLVTPGLIDLHVHAFSGMGQFAVDPDRAGLSTGVTTMLDAGTAGSLTWPAFHRHIIPHAAEDIYALLNISMIGCLQGNPKMPPYMGELNDIRHADVPSAIACIKKFQGQHTRLIGSKVRLTAGLANQRVENERAGLQGAVRVARETSTFCMVHHAMSQIPAEEVFAALQTGDVFTHMYHPHADTPFSGKDGAPCDALRRARDRGIFFDVGHGMGAFGWKIAEPACQQHQFWPDTISTDLHQFNLETPVVDLPTTMSKFLYLGMPLEKVIRAVTGMPAIAMGMGNVFGRLFPGRQADISLLQIEKGSFPLTDVVGEIRTASERIRPVAVVKKGVLTHLA